MSTAVSSATTDDTHEPHVAAQPVVVRRNAGLSALVGAAASAIAIAYLWRATATAAPLDWALCAVLAGIAALHLAQLVDARTPLLVADEHGVRVRFGRHWRGLPWDAVDEVVVQPSRGLLRDGRLVVRPHSATRALEGLDSRGRRGAALNQRIYGAPLAVPMGLTTRVSARGDALEADLAGLAHGRADVVVVRAESPPEPDSVQPEPVQPEPVQPEPVQPEPAQPEPAQSESVQPESSEPEPEPRPVEHVAETSPAPAAGGSSPLRFRDRRLTAWADRGRDDSAATLGSAALLRAPGELGQDEELPESVQLRRPPGGDPEPSPAYDDGRVRPIAILGDPVEPLVVEDFVTEPADDPVIGPELAAARTRVGLSVDELAERTRIRPHVIESIEVDDFAPCGGDFYARGHLRTLARVLGRDPQPLLAHFDRRYATAPINAKRVFEAELATGTTGSMRRTVAGGPNWALLVGVVLALVVTWGAVRLFAAEPTEVLRPAPALRGSAGPVDQGVLAQPSASAPAAAPAPIRVALHGVTATGSSVVVRDRTGEIVWAGTMTTGELKTVRAVPPVTVRATDAGAIDVSVDGTDAGAVGQLGEAGRRSFVAPAAR